MSTDTLEIRQLARQFAESELRPHTEKWDHDAALDPAVLTQLAELGFFGMLVPEAFGGMEFDFPTFVAALEELAWGEPAVALTVAINSVAAHTIVQHGSDAQKRQWLERLASGEAVACIADSEEGEPTRAARTGEAYVLNGRKRWVTNAGLANVALIRTNDGTFIVPRDADGLSVLARTSTLGLRSLEITDVELRDVRVEAGALLEGVTALQGTAAGALGMAAIAIGIAQAALEHGLGYADVREQFGEKLRNFEGLQFKLADMATRIEAARALLQKAAGEPTAALTAMAKVFASESAMWVTTQAVQIYGGYGYMRDYPVEKLMRDAKATELLEGVNEIQRVTIARELYD